MGQREPTVVRFAPRFVLIQSVFFSLGLNFSNLGEGILLATRPD